ncbi:phage tail tape measure protein, partial [Hafnia paralvei]|uniref:phage tail tape measure protein n=1 Tax=Hafnia paralvei TaxID=546367 RepID=UPI00300D7A34
KSLSGNGITEHDAAGALAAVIGSGAFKSNQIESVTKAALAMQQATGLAVSETIKNFQRLYQDPTQGSIELNKQLHYLTSAQYEYIASLERRGYKEAAGEVAADAYSKAEQQRSQQVINNLGLIEKTIQKATKRWNQFWDAALNIGRPQTEQYQIEQVNKAINQIYEDRKKSGKSDLFDSGLQKLLFQKKGLEFVIKSQQGYEESQVKAKKADDDRTDSLIYQNQILSKNMSWQQKRAAALTELWQKVSLAPKDWSQEQRNRAVAQINADNKPPKTTKPKAYHDDEATRLLTQYQQKQAQIQGQIDAAKVSVNEKLTESEKQYLALEERISQMKGKTLTAADKSILAHRQALEIALKQNIASEKALNQQNALNALKKKGTQIDLQRQEEALQARQQQALSIGAIGMGDKVRQRYQEELSLRQNYQRQLAQLERDSEVKGTKGTPEYEEVTRKLQASLNERLIDLKSYYAEEGAAQGDWVNGAIRAYQNIAASAGDAAGIGEQAFMSSFNSMSNGLATFVTTGKLNFKSFTASLLSDLAKIMAQMAMMQAVKGIGSAFGFGLEKNALGGVYSSPSLSAYSGQIVERPTYFKFAKGAGLMGEAGPEAILPLTRDSRGRLAVTAVGGRGMTMFAPQYNVNIQNDGSNGQVGPEALKAVYAVGKKAASDFFAQQRRDGGQLSRGY